MQQLNRKAFLRIVFLLALVLFFIVPSNIRAETSTEIESALSTDESSPLQDGNVGQEELLLDENDMLGDIDIEEEFEIESLNNELLSEANDDSGTDATQSGTWIKSSNGKWRYKHTDGTYTKNAWEKINGKWYYFDSSGWMLTGWQKIGGYWYYLKPGDSGYRMTGWQLIDGYWYYLGGNGKMRTGWQEIDGSKYYFKPGDSGKMVVGWYKISGHWYYFLSNGKMNTEPFHDGQCKYYFYSSGRLRKVLAHVIRQQQEADMWCWAACASMTGHYIIGLPMDQASIVMAVKNTDQSVGATDYETITALRIACNNQKNWEFITNEHFNFQNAVAALDSRKVFVIRFEWNLLHGHCLVCSGYDLKDSKLRLVDPWGDSATTLYNYDALRTLATIESGTGWWNGTYRY